MESISSIIKLPVKKKGSERAELIKFFVDNLKQKNGKPFSARMIAIKLSHLSLEDIRYFISMCKDIKNRRGQEAMQKYFWFSIKIN